MPDEPPLSEVVEQVARGPAASEFDGTSRQEHNLKDLDAVASKQAATRAVRKPHRGLFFSKLVPPGANG